MEYIPYRAVCTRCLRPESVCYCRHLPSIDTVTRVVILQHPRERDVAIGTARMASLGLRNSELHVGVSWEGSPELDRALSDPARPAALLYPGEGSVDVEARPPAGPITLIVVDGTWAQARKLVRQNPRIAALPRYAFVPRAPSEYRIRKEPHETYVSTIESLVHVLSVLEGDRARFEALLRPFRAMIDAQIEHENRLHGARVRHEKKRDHGPWLPHLPALLRKRPGDLLCVIGEANAWPCDKIHRRPAYPDELVQWIACRPCTGEVFEAFVAPSNPMGPNTILHTRLSLAQIASGGRLADELERWKAFLRPSDVLCTWGHYAESLFAWAGGDLPRERIDLRVITRNFLQTRVEQLEDTAQRLGDFGTAPVVGAGRGGERLGQLVHLTRRLVEVASLRA